MLAMSRPLPWMTVFLDVPAASQAETERFWTAVTGTHLSPRRGPDGTFVTLRPPRGDAYLRVQRVASGPGGIHLDLHSEDPHALAEAAVAAGAVLMYAEPGLVVLRSPGGLALCAVELHESGVVPEPLGWPASEGTTTRLDQVCLDCPPGLLEPELAFWAGLTGWDEIPCTAEEFELLRPPEGTSRPLQLLFQRLETATPGLGVTAHLGCRVRARSGGPSGGGGGASGAGRSTPQRGAGLDRAAGAGRYDVLPHRPRPGHRTVLTTGGALRDGGGRAGLLCRHAYHRPLRHSRRRSDPAWI